MHVAAVAGGLILCLHPTHSCLIESCHSFPQREPDPSYCLECRLNHHMLFCPTHMQPLLCMNVEQPATKRKSRRRD
ncbi:hypothetical protein BKA80DRAFT_267716 [Phyllosticta citrichinensis]